MNGKLINGLPRLPQRKIWRIPQCKTERKHNGKLYTLYTSAENLERILTRKRCPYHTEKQRSSITENQHTKYTHGKSTMVDHTESCGENVNGKIVGCQWKNMCIVLINTRNGKVWSWSSCGKRRGNTPTA